VHVFPKVRLIMAESGMKVKVNFSSRGFFIALLAYVEAAELEKRVRSNAHAILFVLNPLSSCQRT
jgi:hypothetical protein